jgi:RND family efflux transporter MFP subunit
MKADSHFPGILNNLLLFPSPFPLVWAWSAILLAVSAQAAELRCTGIIEPFLDVTLSAPVPGIVVSRKFEEGSFIQEGAVLLELDSNLEQLEVERRKVVRDQKRSDFEGTQKLFQTTKGISKEEVEKKEAEYKVAAVEHDMAVEQKRRRQVIAPLSGTITEIMLEVGEACQPYQPLLRVVDARRCYLVAYVEATQGSRLKPDQQVSISLDDGDGKATLPGKIAFLSPVVDPASGLQKIKILFENKDGKVRPGCTGIMLSENRG